MPRALRGFVLALGCVWAILLIAAILYSKDQNIPFRIAAAVVPAFLLESALYLAAGMEATRRLAERLKPPVLALMMTAAGPLSYCIYAGALGMWHARGFAVILLIAAVVAFWYVIMPRGNAGVDLVFLAIVAGVVLSRVFDGLYPDPMPRIDMKVLGTAMLVRTGILAVLSLRKMEGIGFGLLPRPRDWAWGVAAFLLLLPAAFALGIWLGFLHTGIRPFTPRLLLVGLATFAGMLWVVALSEEFFFRGLLQQLMAKLLGNAWAGLAVASLLFGAAHLPFRAFPNWRFAVIATVAGAFYGFAYMRTRSIRAAMVTHALTATAWRVLLS